MTHVPGGEPKVLVFGMDGATWDVLAPLVAAGRVPTIARLVRDGASGPLASTVHPHSPTAWTSFLTGLDPGGHGIFDFVRRRPGSYATEVVSTRGRGGRAVWQTLSERGVRCGVMNVPMTYPPEKVAGYFVSGVFTSDPFGTFSYPTTLLDDVKRATGHPYVVDARRRTFEEASETPDPAELADFLRELNEVEERRADAALYLIERFAPRFVVHVVTSTDRAQHTFWRYLPSGGAPGTGNGAAPPPLADAIASTYVEADRQLARLLAAMGEDTTVYVMSDHGGGPLRRVLLVNAWLAAEGYLATERPARLSRRALVRSAFRTAVKVAKRTLPPAVRAQLAGRLDVGHRTSMRFLRPTAIDWARTRAFSEGTFGNIVLNVQGREPLGTVAPGAEYDALRAEIRAKLEALVDPATGEPAVERTFAREELYRGSRVDQAPDVIAVLKEGYQMVGDYLAVHRGSGRIPAGVLFADGGGNRFRISGIHTPTGVLVAHGRGIAPGSHFEGAHITDLAPTILRAFGVDGAPAMDGQVLRELVTT